MLRFPKSVIFWGAVSLAALSHLPLASGDLESKTTTTTTVTRVQPRPAAEPSGFPGVGHTYEAVFEEFTAQLSFASQTEMIFNIVEGKGNGAHENARVSIMGLRPGLFTVSWQDERHDTWIQSQDYTAGVAYTIVVSAKDHSIRRMKATWKKLK